MGIFSFFFKRPEEEEETDEILEIEEVEYAPSKNVSSGQVYRGMQIDVSEEGGEPLLTGQVAEFNASIMVLHRLPGELSFATVPLNSMVNLNGYDKMLIPIHYTGIVMESTRIVFKVKDLKVESHPENRTAFRLPYPAAASLYRREDTLFSRPEECELVDISTGGCCIQTDYVHMEDEVLRIRIKIEDYAPLTFLGQIVRCMERGENKFRYGILFAQLTDRETDSLNKTLYNLQMGIKETHLRSDSSSWYNNSFRRPQ